MTGLSPRVGLLLLLAICAAAYIGVAQAGFVWDDRGLVLGNPALGALSNLPSFFGVDLWASSAKVASGYYRPVFLSWLALVRAVAGESALAWHLGGLGWHLLAVALLHRLLSRVVCAEGALLGAACFALHPVQSEAVAWIAANNDPVAAALTLGALVLVEPLRPGPARLLGGALLAALAAMSKETALMSPALLLTLDLARGRRDWSRPAALGLGVGVAVLARLLAGVGGAWPEGWQWMVALRTAPVGAATLSALLVWPWPLSAARSVEWMTLPWWRWALGLGVSLGAVALFVRTRRPLVRAGLAWAVLAFAPAVLAIADKGLVGERYLYLPMAGLALALGALVQGRRALLGLAVLPLWLLALHARLPDWASSLSIWEASLRDLPDPYVHYGYAEALRELGQQEPALEHFTLALAGDPLVRDACAPALELRLATGRLDEAISLGRAVLHKGCAGSPRFMGLHAVALATHGDWEEARQVLAHMKSPDPSGRARVVSAALARIDGQEDRYQEILSDDALVLAPQVARLLAVGGHPELATPVEDAKLDPGGP